MAGRPKGLPRTGGRKPGTPNKVTADVRALAQQYGADAISILHCIAKSIDTPAAARVSACKELLDRGYGKAPQPMTVDPGNFAEVFGKLMNSLPA
jgi:enoyl-[acyl-carrier-protein] reductase (NADH)